ncbi:MAG: sulfite exporter TauE/SafE family protein, partial [Sporichthyaceae bacterium]|nr:sulfite exporter TauE/SafE family protein [Sporichthyaceae bacterium]
MTPFEALAVTVAGMAAGTINAVVGAGTLITFPVLLGIGYPAVVANVSNTIGLVPGVFSGVIGYRRELVGQRDRLIRLGFTGALGGLTGALLLLWLPESVFDAVVPALILLGVALVLAQPHLARFVVRQDAPPHGGPLLVAGVYLVGVYGGYFGAAQGVLLLGLLG